MKDFLKNVWKPLMKEALEKNIKIVTNAGGMNPAALKVAAPHIPSLLSPSLLGPSDYLELLPGVCCLCVQAAIEAMSHKAGLPVPVVGCVMGDDLSGKINELREDGKLQGFCVDNLKGETEGMWRQGKEMVMSSNAYTGAREIAHCLSQGAQIVITVRQALPQFFFAFQQPFAKKIRVFCRVAAWTLRWCSGPWRMSLAGLSRIIT